MQKWLQLWKMDLVQKVSHGVFEGSSEEPVALMNHDYIVLGKYILSETKNLALNNVNKTVDIAVKRLVACF